MQPVRFSDIQVRTLHAEVYAYKSQPTNTDKLLILPTASHFGMNL